MQNIFSVPAMQYGCRANLISSLESAGVNINSTEDESERRYFFLNCLLNKNRSIYARHHYIAFYCRLLRANNLHALYKLKPSRPVQKYFSL